MQNTTEHHEILAAQDVARQMTRADLEHALYDVEADHAFAVHLDDQDGGNRAALRLQILHVFQAAARRAGVHENEPHSEDHCAQTRMGGSR